MMIIFKNLVGEEIGIINLSRNKLITIIEVPNREFNICFIVIS